MHTTKVRVRYAETDQMGVAYNVNYFIWFEVGRTEYMRDINIPYSLLEKKGIFMPVVENHCRYIKPALYDQLLTINTKITELRAASIKFQYEILDGEELLAEGYVKLAFTDKNMRPINMKKMYADLWEILDKYCEDDE
ncbi:acyl-CoA thioester hydrolase [Caldanaerobius fijiensis DSM 17918]|uniref:Acyl-CoA thioester hydrolase n=1 Tax=Caldanaerobius fijiensis DSM 17918 TaxID=1121256 RepID=A0A1M5AZK2_9THEO|nr:thioesterase family protein [Caldanaerobius fijiensis]SHF35507.1 acyl-CoA thioester hydrolase [Caldanaerobius fijiensis DSM 17918]